MFPTLRVVPRTDLDNILVESATALSFPFKMGNQRLPPEEGHSWEAVGIGDIEIPPVIVPKELMLLQFGVTNNFGNDTLQIEGHHSLV